MSCQIISFRLSSRSRFTFCPCRAASLLTLIDVSLTQGSVSEDGASFKVLSTGVASPIPRDSETAPRVEKMLAISVSSAFLIFSLNLYLPGSFCIVEHQLIFNRPVSSCRSA